MKILRKLIQSRLRVAVGGLFCFVALASGQKSDFETIKVKAASGDAEAQFRLGFMYDVGVGVPKNYAESGKWYLKAANQGVAEAQLALGVRYYEYGGQSKEHYKTAFGWFQKAAHQGLREAQFNLAVMYELGRGVSKNTIESYKWLILAATEGNPKSLIAREQLAQELSRADLAEGERRAAAFVPRRKYKPQLGALGEEAPPKTAGTGFFVTSDGYLVTNFHVIEEATNCVVKTRQGRFPATVIKTDKVNDLALLKVSGSFNPISMATNREVRLGQSVFTIGFPNPEVQGLEPKLTRGEISSLAGMKDDPRHFQISVPVQPGNSGGPLVNLAGDVIGIVTQRLGDLATLKTTGALPQNVNYAVKANLLGPLLEEMPEVRSQLRVPHPSGERKFEDVVKEVEEAVVIILGY